MAIDVVQQIVEVEKVVKKEVVQRVEVPLRPSRQDWPVLLTELVDQLDRDRIYDRDLGELATALSEVLQALERRPAFRRLVRRSRSL